MWQHSNFESEENTKKSEKKSKTQTRLKRARPLTTSFQAAFLCILTPRMPKALRTRPATTVLRRGKEEAELESVKSSKIDSLMLFREFKEKKTTSEFQVDCFFIFVIKHWTI